MISKQIGVIRSFTKRIILVSTLMIGICFFNNQTVNAQETNAKEKNDTETISKEEGAVRFLDEDGNVMAVYIPYSETNPAPSIQPRYMGSVDWSVGRGSYAGSSRFELTTNSRIDLNISISPNASSNIGLYDTKNDKYGWPEGGESTTGWYGTMAPNYAGNFSIAIANNTDKVVTYKGTFTVR